MTAVARRPARHGAAHWVPDVLVGVVVALLGLAEIATTPVTVPDERASMLAVAVVTGLTVGLIRRLPGLALALVWLTCSVQLLTDTGLMLVQLSVALVAFGTARWGRAATVWLSGLSIPAAAVIVLVIVYVGGLRGLAQLAGNKLLVDALRELGTVWQLTAAGVGVLTLGAPWLIGLVLRFGARAEESRVSQAVAEEDAARAFRETEQAREIARLREEQARLARDVHDVVGHSLAVILAQAESAQYRDDADTAQFKITMANIATSARTSLRDVRQVLSETQQGSSQHGGLDTLIGGARSSGHEVVTSVIGTARPLPPELAEVAYRVLQEMLTNAIKYGDRDSPVAVEREWGNALRIEVRNVIGDHGSTGTSAGGGQGLDGMRRRLESIGGQLELRRADGSAGTTFIATAWLPIRAGTR
ncbi:sensor histidine kinase [Microlunatus speluncae]|uniref:sensor histidine kinase n=1 Tax=Microlunatus speluncae TaxID=2594267 RepID=UPI0012661225|nr:histidine kinase [Microlunatus speluncae]